MKRELERLAARGLSATDAYAALRDQLWSAGVGTLVEAGELRAVDLASDRRASFDVWNLRNESITIGGLAISLVALVFFLPAWIKSD